MLRVQNCGFVSASLSLMPPRLRMLTLQCIAAAMLVETGLSFFHSRVCIVSEISDQQSSLIMRRQRQSKSLGFSMQFDFAGREPAVPRSHDLRSGNGLPHRGSLKGRRRQRRQGTGPLRRGVLPSASASEGTTESATSSISATPVAQIESAVALPAATATAVMHHNEDFLFEQKVESVKAALLCGGVGSVTRLLAVGAGALAPDFLRDALGTPEPVASSLLFCLASGFAQGALFGLTYRYVVRTDRSANTRKAAQMDGFTVSHLGDGCVAAFALTSALGQSEGPLTIAAGEFLAACVRGGVMEALSAVLVPLLPFLPRAVGDLLLYSATRAAIDRALDEGGIKPFP